jgi:hypothetical protein
MEPLIVKTLLLQYGLSLKPDERIFNISSIIDEAINDYRGQEVTWYGIVRLHEILRERLSNG